MAQIVELIEILLKHNFELRNQPICISSAVNFLASVKKAPLECLADYNAKSCEPIDRSGFVYTASCRGTT